jgi:hypothetical protein
VFDAWPATTAQVTHQANDVERDPQGSLVHVDGGGGAQRLEAADQLVHAVEHEGVLLLDVLCEQVLRSARTAVQAGGWPSVVRCLVQTAS